MEISTNQILRWTKFSAVFGLVLAIGGLAIAQIKPETQQTSSNLLLKPGKLIAEGHNKTPPDAEATA